MRTALIELLTAAVLALASPANAEAAGKAETRAIADARADALEALGAIHAGALAALAANDWRAESEAIDALTEIMMANLQASLSIMTAGIDSSGAPPELVGALDAWIGLMAALTATSFETANPFETATPPPHRLPRRKPPPPPRWPEALDTIIVE